MISELFFPFSKKGKRLRKYFRRIDNRFGKQSMILLSLAR
ncbi:hypothetical protein C942_01011 [Photobacterium marinum]|uniref:Uncharacterized protein n=1 Tax=Photobacterium marinum TaxID=1056511 RepID=L8JDL6_9GAMM|nr:hypothetical protein C942_01011 [Photobacterium marinum]